MGPHMGMPAFSSRKAKTVVGLDIEAASVAATEVVVNGDVKLGRSGIAPLAAGVSREGEVGDAAALTEAIKDLFAANKLSRNVRLGLANQRVVVRTLRMPRIEDRDEAEAAIRFQAQEEVPMPLEQAVLDWQIIGSDPEVRAEGKMDVVVVAARREMVSNLARVVRDAGLRPIGLDVSAFALVRALGGASAPSPVSYEERGAMGEGAEVATGGPAQLLCNLGDITNLVVARNGDCLFTRVSPFGVEGIAQRLAERRELTLEHSRQWLNHVGVETPAETVEGDPEIVGAAREVLDDGVAKLVDELRLSLDYYGAQEGARSIEEIVVCGPGSVIPGLPAEIERRLGYALRVGSPPALASLDAAASARLTVPYGLALEE
jgi:type IV pilus assembly protein PilM